MSKQVIAGVAVAPGQVVCGVMAPAKVQPEVPTIGEHWCHSICHDLPEMTWEDFKGLMVSQYGLTILYRSMQADPDVDWEDELEIESWNPKSPFAGDEAFMLVLSEDEDGPFAVWGLPK